MKFILASLKKKVTFAEKQKRRKACIYDRPIYRSSVSYVLYKRGFVPNKAKVCFWVEKISFLNVCASILRIYTLIHFLNRALSLLKLSLKRRRPPPLKAETSVQTVPPVPERVRNKMNAEEASVIFAPNSMSVWGPPFET